SRDADATGEIRSARIDRSPDEPLRLHVFLDGSVIEVFANGRASITDRIYPSRPDSLGVGLLARAGRATLTSLDVWEMDSIWTSEDHAPGREG
ncbi:MAG: GH32 C-terminal domain-containing protein, partial [Thermomicrobiales bacterium]